MTYLPTTHPLRGNRTWTITPEVTREQITGGCYWYHTPVGVVACYGETSNWRLHYDTGFTTSLRTLTDCDAVIRSWMAELEELGVVDQLTQG
jgi:hypothetical protein